MTFLRAFSLSQVAKKGVDVAGWETFDHHPDLIAFEGYLKLNNEAHLEFRSLSGLARSQRSVECETVYPGSLSSAGQHYPFSANIHH